MSAWNGVWEPITPEEQRAVDEREEESLHRPNADTAERPPSPRDDDQNIDWNARAEYLEAYLSTLKSRIDVEGMARIVDPVAFEEFYLEDGRVDQEVADIFGEAVEDARAKAQALRTLILGEEVEEQSVSQDLGTPTGSALERELLEALQQLCAVVGNPAGVESEKVRPSYDAAIAAIAKAGGR